MANWFKNIFGRGSRSRAVVPAPPPTRTNIMYDAWQKVTNAPLTDFSPQELAGMKYSNRAGYMVELERLYSTMYHEWPTLQKDLSDVAESVAMLDWSVSPAVDDGGQPSAKAREVADVVSRAIWARLPQKPGTFTHGFLELIEAAVHGYYRGVNVHEIRWQFTKDLAFPAGFEPVWPQYYMWEMRCGEEDRLMMVPDGCNYSNPVPFPPHKFVLAMNNSGPDHPMYNGVLYSLLGYFLAAKCGLPWLQEYVLRYGHPVRKFKVQSKEDERKLREELELNDDLMDVFLRNGRELDITAIPAGANIPHEVLLKLAENMCHQVILGQTLTSDTSEDGGSRAQAQVHERVQNSVILKRAEWVCRLLNRGLVLDIVAMNYGEDALSTLPLPEIKCSLPDEGLNIDRVQVCKELLAIPGFAVAKSFIYEFLRIPMPAEGEDTFNTPEPPAHDHGGFGGLFGGFGGNTPPDGAGTPPKGTEDGTEDKRDGSTPTAAQQRENERKSEQEGVNAANADPASMAREHDAATMALLPRVAGDWLAPVLDKLEDMLQAGATPQQVYARLHELTPNTAALEQAMEAVLKSGLGLQTDGVKAENPYGCNQYGEGWAEPHNGNSTGYKNMSPFNPHAPASKVLTNEADGNTVEQSTHSKYVGKDAYPDASNKGRDKEAADAKREEAEKKAKAEAERKAKEEAAKKKAEEEAKKKAEEEARKKAEAEAKKKAELEAKRKAEAEKKKQEAEKKKAEAEAKKKAAAEAKAKEKEEKEKAKKKAAYEKAEDKVKAASEKYRDRGAGTQRMVEKMHKLISEAERAKRAHLGDEAYFNPDPDSCIPEKLKKQLEATPSLLNDRAKKEATAELGRREAIMQIDFGLLLGKDIKDWRGNVTKHITGLLEDDNERLLNFCEVNQRGTGYYRNRAYSESLLEGTDRYDRDGRNHPLCALLERSLGGAINNFNNHAYGDIFLKFKPEVRERTTFTGLNSLGSMGYGVQTSSLLTDPTKGQPFTREQVRRLNGGESLDTIVKSTGRYLEAQVRGLLTAQHIESIGVPKKAYGRGATAPVDKEAENKAKQLAEALARVTKRKTAVKDAGNHWAVVFE